MQIKLLDKNDKRLKEKCEEVDDFTNMDYYKEIIECMKEECIRQHAFASAAPQFGINKRFILIITTQERRVKNVEELNNLEIEYSSTPYFNPVITKVRGLQYFYEACISVGDVIGKVARPYHVEFDYQDINGNYGHKVVEGFEAIVCCHELDHLDGIEFTDKAEDIRYGIDENKIIEIRNSHPRDVISKDCEFLQESIGEKYRTVIKSDRKVKRKK